MSCRRRLPALLLVLLTALVFLTNQNGEFYRDEDYEYLTYATSVAQFFLHLPAALTNLDEAVYRVAQAGHALLFHRHGPVPVLYNGLFYAAAEAAGLPMTVRLYQLPTALLAMAAVLLCWRVLRREGVTPWVAFLGAAILCLSPLFASLGRGLHTWTWVWIPLGQVLALYALQDIRDGKSRWLAGVLLANAILGDGLFFLTLPALAAAFALRDWTWSPTPSSVTGALRCLPSSLAPLAIRPVVLPVGFALALITVSGVLTVMFRGRVGEVVPLDSLALLALGNHGGDAGLNLSPVAWLHSATVALGDTAPLLFAFIIASLALLPKRGGPGLVGNFSVIAGLGFGAVFYVASPYSPGTLQTYQIYTVLPLVLAVALLVERVRAVASPRLTRTLPWVAVIVLLSMAGSALHYIAGTNTAFQRRLLADNDFGADKPLFGTKAAGGLARSAIEAALRRNPAQAVTVELWRGNGGGTPYERFGGFRNWTSPFIAFAGLGQKGDFYANLIQRPVMVQYHVHDEVPAALPDCGADLCVKVDMGEPCGETQELVEDTRRLAALVLCDGTARSARRLDARTLTAEFDRRWVRLSDIFPDRPPERRAAILSRLGVSHSTGQ